MIRIDLATAIAIYLFILMIGLFVAWLLLDYRKKVGTDTGKETPVWQCSVCTHVYTVDENQDISRCPNCKSYNKRAHKLRSP